MANGNTLNNQVFKIVKDPVGWDKEVALTGQELQMVNEEIKATWTPPKNIIYRSPELEFKETSPGVFESPDFWQGDVQFDDITSLINNEPAKTATADSPVVDRGTTEAEQEKTPTINTGFNIDDSSANRTRFFEIQGKDPANLTDEDKGFLRQLQASTNLGVDSLGTRQTEAQQIQESRILEEGIRAREWIRANLNAQRDKALSDARRVADDREQKLKSSLSFSGFGRSSVAVERLDDAQRETQDYMNKVNAQIDAQIALEEAKERNATGEELKALNESFLQKQKIADESLTQNLLAISELDSDLDIKGKDALDNLVNTIATSPDGARILENKGFDEKTSLALGYISDKFGTPVKVDSEGNPISFKTTTEDTAAKITNVKDWNDNTFIYKNGQLNSIITNSGEILQWDQLNTVQVPASVKEDKAKDERRKFETTLRKEYNGLPIVKNFNEINSQFNRVQSSYDRSSFAQTWIWDISMIFSYMKMLDPTSVVREWEFATAQNSWGVSSWILNAYNKALTWQFLTETQRDEFLWQARDILEREGKTVEDVQQNYRDIAEEAWLRSDFIFDDSNRVPTIGQQATTQPQETFKTSSGFEFDFNAINPTAWTTVSQEDLDEFDNL